MSHEAHPDAHALGDLALAFDSIRENLPIPGHPSRPPALVHLSHQLNDLSEALAELSDEVSLRAAEDASSAEDGRTIAALTSAAVPAGRAALSLTQVYEQLGFHCQVADYPDSPDLREAREAANAVILGGLAASRHALLETSRVLNRRADELVPTGSPLAAAGRARTTKPVTPQAHSHPMGARPPAGEATPSSTRWRR